MRESFTANTEPQVPSGRPRLDPTKQLVDAGAELMADALRAYAEDRPVKVAVLAPLGLEHLAKAVLWRTNPVLLLPLERDKEPSLRLLATTPNLNNPRLRTIGLALALDRVHDVVSLPGSKKSWRALVTARNGAVHVGEASPAREVLAIALQITDILIAHLSIARDDFYQDHTATVDDILDQRRHAIHLDLGKRKAAARVNIGELRNRLGEPALQALEKQAVARVPDEVMLMEDRGAVTQACPVCDYLGNIEGDLDVDYNVDVEAERTFPGEWEPIYSSYPYWILTPDRFYCLVCGFTVAGAQELAALGLPAESYEPQEDEIRTNANLIETAAAADFSILP